MILGLNNIETCRESELIEISENKGNCYLPVVANENWRVSLMTDMDKYLPNNIMYMQKHCLTDECFILLKGNCTLFVSDGIDLPGNDIMAFPMEQCKVYNVKKGVWHTHAFSKNSLVLIVENENTNDSNSPKSLLNEIQKAYIVSNFGL